MDTNGVKRTLAALLLCLAGAMVSGLLHLQHHGEGQAVSAVNQVCGEDGTSDCEVVARSSWSAVGGLPVAALGLVFYSSLALLLALTLLVPGDLRPTLAGLAIVGLAFGLLVDLFLLGVQALAVRAFCSLCILTYVLSALALFALLPAWRGAMGLGAALQRAEGRLAVAGWALGTVALAGAVLASEVVLDYREQGRQLALLGAPAPVEHAPPPVAETEPTALPTDRPEPEGAPSEASPEDAQAAERWRLRAQELQETLDDPQKLEQYFTRKAQAEFESAQPQPIDLDNVPIKGSADAPVQVVEYSDFLCPFCRNLALGLSQFVPQAGGRVAVYFKNYPLDAECNESLPRSTHPGACQLALGAICAHNQGKFEAYHDRVFTAEGLRNPGPADVMRLAGEAGLNAAAMRGCLDDPVTHQTLADQIAEGRRLDVRATPTLYVNGKKLPRISDLVPVVDKEAQKNGFPPLAQ